MPCEALLSIGERQEIRTTLQKEWKGMHDMIFHEQQAPLGNVTSQRSMCQKLGMCVCDGSGHKAFTFHKKLVGVLRPLFTPLRQRKQKQPDGSTKPVEFSAAQKEKQIVLKSRRKVLNDSFLVIRLDHKPSANVIQDAQYVHRSWSALARRSLGQVSTVDKRKVPSLWLHLGYANLSTWEMAVLPLRQDGEPDDQGVQRLIVHDPAADTVSLFAKSIDFDITWSLQAYSVINDGRMLGLEEMCPNWVLVQEMNLDAVEFWHGWLQESKAQKEAKSAQPPRKRGGPASSEPKAKQARLTDVARSSRDGAADAGHAGPDPAEPAVPDRPDDGLDTLEPDEDEENKSKLDEEENRLHDIMDDVSQADSIGSMEALDVDAPEVVAEPSSSSRPGPANPEAGAGSHDGPDTEPPARARASPNEEGDRGPRKAAKPTTVVSMGMHEIRFNAESNSFMAVCRRKEHNLDGSDCKKVRTANKPSRNFRMNPGQGRPLGLLASWLLAADAHATGSEHKDAIVQ